MKRIILHIHTFCLLTLLCPAGLAAQSVIRGIVIDRESQLPVEACSCRSAMYHISPRFARESFVFAKKCGESAHTSPAKPGGPQKSTGIP